MQLSEALDQTAITTEPSSKRQWEHVIYVFLRDPLALFGIIIILLVVILALFGSQIAPYPEQGAGRANVATRLLPPSVEHLFGTDDLGRDVLSRVIMGSRIALGAAIVVVTVVVAIGAPLGALAGYLGGWVDNVIMRLTDLFLAFPSLLLAIAIVAILGPSLPNAMLAVTVSWWPWYARLVRGVTLSLREQHFVEAARSIGVRDIVIIFRHILPNCISPVIIQATIDFGLIILATSALAFLGLGTRSPMPDWGLMVSQGRNYVLDEWWFPTFPGLAIFITTLAFNLVGDTLRDIFDPRQYR